MHQQSRIYAILPAAGRSRRMGQDKQLLEVGGEAMLRRVLDEVNKAQVEHIFLVTHSRIVEQLNLQWKEGTSETEQPVAYSAVESAIPKGRLTVIINDDPQTEMIDSVRLGLTTCLSRLQPQSADGFAVLPADQPGITTEHIDRCIHAFRQHPERIAIAASGGRKGHPIIFARPHADFVLSARCDSGLNQLPRQYPQAATLVECGSDGVVQDVDTPEDYDAL